MRKQWSCVFVALGMAATTILGAQGNPSPANNPPPDAAAPPGVQRQTLPPPAEAKANTVMISGCIQDAPMAAAGVTTAAPVVASAKTFYLNHATLAADASRDRGAVGTSGLSKTGYKLDGETALITLHLNHQVRIVGNLAPGSTGALPTLKVESLTMVAAKCEEPKA